MMSLKDLLLWAQELSKGEIASIRASLEGKTVKELRWSPYMHKADIADHLIMMGKIGAAREGRIVRQQFLHRD